MRVKVVANATLVGNIDGMPVTKFPRDSFDMPRAEAEQWLRNAPDCLTILEDLSPAAPAVVETPAGPADEDDLGLGLGEAPSPAPVEEAPRRRRK